MALEGLGKSLKQNPDTTGEFIHESQQLTRLAHGFKDIGSLQTYMVDKELGVIQLD